MAEDYEGAGGAAGGSAGAGVSYARRPDSLLSLRACIGCRLVKTLNQFQDDFCENCWRDWADGQTPGSFKKGRCLDLALENTTADYEGLTSMMRPFDSWVCKWLKMNRVGEDGKKTLLIPGVYAITLPGYQRSRAAPAEEYEEDEGAEEEVAAAGAKRRGGGGRGGAMEDSEAEEAAEGEEEEEEEQEEEEEEDE